MSEIVESTDETGPARPESLTVDFYAEPDGIAIHTRRGGGPGVFLLLWLIGWTVGCVALAAKVIDEPTLWTILFAIPFWASWLFVAALVMWSFFGQETLLLRREDALFLRKALVTISTRIVPRAEIRNFQECPSLHTEDNEHQWGIELVTVGKPLRFAFGLPVRERAWLIYQLNQFAQTPGTDLTRGVLVRPMPMANYAALSHVAPADLAVAECEALIHERTQTEPPTDCRWRFVDDIHFFEFWQRGQLSLGTLGMVLFLNAFWNGIVSVFVLGLLGLGPNNNNAPQGWEWWGLFVFLIPFEVIGLGMFAALVYIVLEPFRQTVWRFEEDRVTKQTRWPLFWRTRAWDIPDLDRLELRRVDAGDSKRSFSRATADLAGESQYELAIVSRDNTDVCNINDVTEGEARWLGRFILERRSRWFGGQIRR